MGSFESDLGILETELGVVAKAFGELNDEQWRAPTLLTPLDENARTGRSSSWPGTSTSRSA